ncbi:bifunctional [glutamine synthetase] adenylyltransferase/[glutamine synthetase]-adenylyl-L-tyrosine phosphorylase [Actibacterium sp. XHP0104]|uniref:bifunctional [glutamine synthetase] adenylyltransferase/[glutamine synthetase]-adenylyl-L-tyrosine phosphorylase n=1 Tax=Actibacterium sp. XHP0104 TaxID=2984335 RepID=UPI0021E751A3|nr:bifunctional [glutamine synthetase] adenylyltransferase/[glutamine synthetase]-adenylyl-L-tyrosine phosphorylase [Actibacterium sp. XHP0104]MCV2880901.1 bifunctional [glutamine synthetase] adenylyltransferase/[glutamine synthetase]-adenylyl-L-tyrosine phosphorylase [Actibacterium sp. XHP0104]
MNFQSRITRAPIPYDLDRAAELPERLQSLAPEMREVLQGTLGCSPYLKGLTEKEDEWLEGALARAPEDAFAAILADMRALELDQLSSGLRQAKRRAALLIGLADVAGVWPLEDVTRALTDLADTAVDCAFRRLVAAEIKRGKLPGAQPEDAETAGGMVALSMGKQGAHELNYSSDIDLICLFDQDRFEPDDYHDARASFIRVTRKMTSLLSDQTGEGYVFRTDLRLRPDAAVTPVCMAMEAAERYYESLGRTWERAAHIKARPGAGDIQAGWDYLERLRPFVWRKHLDFAAIQDAHDMRMAIRDHKGLHGKLVLEGHDMKLGMGGIREIEFFTQTRQLIAGGRDPDLRVRGTVEGLARLAEKDWVPQAVAEQLTADYRAHREVEHRLQMVADAQTHRLPKSDENMDRIARFMGFGDTAVFRAELTERLRRVDELTEGFFAPGQPSGKPDMPTLSETSAQVVERWHTYPALRSQRAVEIFARLKPEILTRLQKAAKPDEALAAFDGFLEGLPAGVQIFSLFQANPQLIDLIVNIAATAPELARYLSRNAGVLDAVIGGDFFADWPGVEALTEDLTGQLSVLGDYEKELDAARRWNKEWHFRIGVHFLRGLISADEASGQYADLAQAVLAAVWPCVAANFTTKHGTPPGKGAVVMGMGSLGAGRLTGRSDLDLIVIYDADGVEESDGRRPLASRAYYARLTQALVTALSAPMAEGKLYEVDMRLRPSGNQGPVATSFAAFQSYQRDEAWVWEHLALTRARAVAGAADLAQEIEDFRRQLLVEKGDKNKIVDGIVDMRARLAEAKPSKGDWDAKQGAGGGQDIELIASAAALMVASPATRVVTQLRDGAAGSGWIGAEDAEALSAAYELFRKVEIAAKLLTAKPFDPEAMDEGARAFFLSATGAERVRDLHDQMRAALADSAARINALLGGAAP